MNWKMSMSDQFYLIYSEMNILAQILIKLFFIHFFIIIYMQPIQVINSSVTIQCLSFLHIFKDFLNQIFYSYLNLYFPLIYPWVSLFYKMNTVSLTVTKENYYFWPKYFSLTLAEVEICGFFLWMRTR